MNVVVILPTYNEKGNVDVLIPVLQEKIFPKIKNHKMSILVVDDNSPDGTAEEVGKLIKKYKNIQLITGKKKGLGAAYVKGMTHAVDKMKAEILFEMDADGQHDPQKIPQFLKKIDDGYDMVIGTRYSDGGSIPQNWPIQRKAFSVLGNIIVRAVLGTMSIHDWTGGYRALKKEVFQKEKKQLSFFKGYTFQVAFLHKAIRDGYKVAEIPFHFTDRTLGKSKIAPKEFIVDLLKYIFTARFHEMMKSPFPKYGITGVIGYLINAISLEAFTRAGLHPGLAALIGAELSIMWNFSMNNLWSFKGYKITHPTQLFSKFFQFNLVSGGSLLIISSFIWLTTHMFGNTSLVRQLSLIIAIGLFVVPYSYSMYNIFIWKRWHIPFLSKIQNKF